MLRAVSWVGANESLRWYDYGKIIASAVVHKLQVSSGSDRNTHESSGIGPDCEGRRVKHAAQAGGGVVCAMGIACPWRKLCTRSEDAYLHAYQQRICVVKLRYCHSLNCFGAGAVVGVPTNGAYGLDSPIHTANRSIEV